MSILTLVRHGQASFFENNYDKLSALGERQSVTLGEYWATQGARFDQIYFGPAQRHIRTGELVGQAFRTAGIDWPEPIPLLEVDEFQGIEVMRTFLPLLAGKHAEIGRLEKSFRDAGRSTEAARIYELLFQRVTRLWVTGELEAEQTESWRAFVNRVQIGIARARSGLQKSGRAVIFTSGGPIAVAAGLALGLKDETILELSWNSRNASYSDFLSSGERFSLSSFNSYPHLNDAALLSYR